MGVIEGFSAPESVRCDPEQDVRFVGNMTGDGNLRGANGFISRVQAESGTVESPRFAQGTLGRPVRHGRAEVRRVPHRRPGTGGLEPLGPTVVLMDAGGGRPLIRTPGRPADIGVDTRRRRVALPYVALDRVDVWALLER